MKKLVSGILVSTMVLTNINLVFASDSWMVNKYENAASATVIKLKSECAYDSYYSQFQNMKNMISDSLSKNFQGEVGVNLNSNGKYIPIKISLGGSIGIKDDGKSLLVDGLLDCVGLDETDTPINISGKAYLDNNKIVVNIPYIFSQKLLLDLNDKPEDIKNGTIASSFSLKSLKYSFIEKLVSQCCYNIGKIDKLRLQPILMDYYTQLNTFIQKGDFAVDNNNITITLNPTLINSYINSLSNKLKNDYKFNKAFFTTFAPSIDLQGGNADSDYHELINCLNGIVVPDGVTLQYKGQINNNYLTNNKLTIDYNGNNIATFEINFSDIANATLTSNVNFEIKVLKNKITGTYKNEIKDGNSFTKSFNCKAYNDDALKLKFTFDTSGTNTNFDYDFDGTQYITPIYYRTVMPTYTAIVPISQEAYPNYQAQRVAEITANNSNYSSSQISTMTDSINNQTYDEYVQEINKQNILESKLYQNEMDQYNQYINAKKAGFPAATKVFNGTGIVASDEKGTSFKLNSFNLTSPEYNVSDSNFYFFLKPFSGTNTIDSSNAVDIAELTDDQLYDILIPR